MHLTLPFPASVDDLADFIAAARQLGGTALEIHIDSEPVGHDAPDDSTALVVVLSGVAQLAAPPEPAPTPELPPAATSKTPKAKPAPKASTRSTSSPSGGAKHQALTVVADAGGTFHGSYADLADQLHGNPSSGRTAVSQLVRDGFLTAERTSPRACVALRLTAAGWKTLGRTAPKPELAAAPDPPKIPDLGPMERRPFDPDAVRNAQADAP